MSLITGSMTYGYSGVVVSRGDLVSIRAVVSHVETIGVDALMTVDDAVTKLYSDMTAACRARLKALAERDHLQSPEVDAAFNLAHVISFSWGLHNG